MIGLRHAFDHHVWATISLIDACMDLPPDLLDRSVTGIYGGALDTLRHVVGADASYLHRITGGRVPRIDEETMDLAELRAVMGRHASAWTSLLETDLDPDTDVVAPRDDGTVRHAPLGLRLAQALHHGSDHRSQVCTALTSLGIEPPTIDVWDHGTAIGSVVDVASEG